jgi:hypothetical protein
MPRLNLPSSGALALLAIACVTGCDSKDPQKCEEALKVSRQSLEVADFGLAQQWRDRAWKNCADTNALDGLDKEIVAKKTAVEQKTQAEAQRKAQNDSLIKLFTDWAGGNRAAPDRASAAPKCELPDAGAPAKPDEKDYFCTGTRVAGEYTLTVRYWDADKAAVRFQTKPKAPVTCDDLGPNKLVKSWDVPAVGGTVKRSRCELTGGSLSGLVALVTAANNTDLYVFSTQYLEKDPVMARHAAGP